MNRDARIYVAGHSGLVGSALMRRLQAAGYSQVATRTRQELDLRDQGQVRAFFAAERPQYVFLAAARVGGILANATYKADFIYDNLAIATNVIHAAYEFGATKLVNLGSSCIYPRLAPQPLTEDHLLTGPLEPTNEAYAIAKIAAVKLCRYFNEQYHTCFLSAMPTNLYGPHDNFDLQSSHVLAAMIRKYHDAYSAGKSVTLWGDGSPRREFLHVDDLAEALVYLMERAGPGDVGEIVNIGCGEDLSIAELAELVASIVGYRGATEWDTSKPNGTPRKLLDTKKLTRLGWEPRIEIEDGIRSTYEWFSQNLLAAAGR